MTGQVYRNTQRILPSLGAASYPAMQAKNFKAVRQRICGSACNAKRLDKDSNRQVGLTNRLKTEDEGWWIVQQTVLPVSVIFRSNLTTSNALRASSPVVGFYFHTETISLKQCGTGRKSVNLEINQSINLDWETKEMKHKNTHTHMRRPIPSYLI